MKDKSRDLLNRMEDREKRDISDEEFTRLVEKEFEIYNAMTPLEQRAFDRDLRNYEDREVRTGKASARKSGKTDTPSVNRIVKNIEAMGKRPKLKF